MTNNKSSSFELVDPTKNKNKKVKYTNKVNEY